MQQDTAAAAAAGSSSDTATVDSLRDENMQQDLEEGNLPSSQGVLEFRLATKCLN